MWNRKLINGMRKLDARVELNPKSIRRCEKKMWNDGITNQINKFASFWNKKKIYNFNYKHGMIHEIKLAATINVENLCSFRIAWYIYFFFSNFSVESQWNCRDLWYFLFRLKITTIRSTYFSLLRMVAKKKKESWENEQHLHLSLSDRICNTQHRRSPHLV